MSGAEGLFKLARGQTRDQLRAIWKQNGPAAAGIVAEGWVNGIRDALQEFLGPEDTYGMLQRYTRLPRTGSASRPRMRGHFFISIV